MVLYCFTQQRNGAGNQEFLSCVRKDLVLNQDVLLLKLNVEVGLEWKRHKNEQIL